MTYVVPPPGPREYVEVGGNIEPMEPTQYLEFRSGVLHQWFVATRNDKAGGIIHQKGEWRPVPSRS
jgi:hypothetical protein